MFTTTGVSGVLEYLTEIIQLLSELKQEKEQSLWFQTSRVVSVEFPIETTLVPVTVLEYLPTHHPDDLIIIPIVT